MTNLLREPIHFDIQKDIRLIQYISRENSGLAYIEMKLLAMKESAEWRENNPDLEACIVVLTGRATIRVGYETFSNLGTRNSVFEQVPTDSVYASLGREIMIRAESDAQILIAYAPTEKELPTKLIKASACTIERRGKYQNQRLVHNILTDLTTTSDKLLVVEVYTKGGNFSSYPPHKHDQDDLPNESLLEETYYHELNPKKGFVFQRVYTDDLLLNETMTVQNQDVVLVPKGYHPVGVPDGYDSYYLNVMAGPTKKWVFHDDPNHQWILERE